MSIARFTATRAEARAVHHRPATPGTGLLLLLGLLAVLLLSGCTSGRELGVERTELGDFRLGHNIVVEENAQIGPLSRTAEPGAWTEALTREIDRRFSRYDGDRLYHIAINVQAYVLAVPGVPLVLSPKSALILGVTVWDDAAGGKLNETPHRITVLESPSAETAISSGLTQTAEVQMQNLAENAGGAIERWMASNPAWFSATADAAADAAAEAVAAPATGPGPAPVAPRVILAEDAR